LIFSHGLHKHEVKKLLYIEEFFIISAREFRFAHAPLREFRFAHAPYGSSASLQEGFACPTALAVGNHQTTGDIDFS